MNDRAFGNTTEPTLQKLLVGLLAVVKESPPDHGTLACVHLANLVKAELFERTQQTRMNIDRNECSPKWCTCSPGHECEGHRA
jgi:hypothetical protein